MDVRLLKEPAPVFIAGCIITMLCLFIETRIRGEKKPYRDYFVYGIFVGSLLTIMLYVCQMNGKTKGMMMETGDKSLLSRFRV